MKTITVAYTDGSEQTIQNVTSVDHSGSYHAASTFAIIKTTTKIHYISWANVYCITEEEHV